MRSYQVPPDVNEKEKIIGGLLNLNEFFWVLGGLGIGVLMLLITYPFLGKGALFVGGAFALTGLPFVLYKKNGLTLYEYMKRKRDFKKKTKILPNERKNMEW